MAVAHFMQFVVGVVLRTIDGTAAFAVRLADMPGSVIKPGCIGWRLPAFPWEAGEFLDHDVLLMNPFLAILRPAIDRLAVNSSESRQLAYARARRAIADRIQLFDPPPPEHLVQAQMDKLEEAIAAIEREFPS